MSGGSDARDSQAEAGLLDSWKAVADYLNRTVRTVQRWEREQGLPIQRLQHNKQGSIFARVADLDAWVQSRLRQPVEPDDNQGRLEVTDDASERSIAVLPFRDLSVAGDQGYFCDGIVEELIAALSRLPHLRLPSRLATYAAAKEATSTVEAGKRLGVAFVLDGSVRSDAHRVRVNVTLTSIATGETLWTNQFDGADADILSIEEQIAQQAVNAMALRHLAGVPLIREHSGDPEAYRLYLMSRERWNIRTIDGITQSIELAKVAIASDKDYALAYAMLALALMTLASYTPKPPVPIMESARLAATNALMLDPRIASARLALGAVHMMRDWDWKDAEQQMTIARALDQRDPNALQYLSMLNLVSGRSEPALNFSRAAERLEPASLVFAAHTGWLLYFLRRFDAAAEQLQRVMARDPRFWRAYVNAGWTLLARGRAADGLAMMEMAAALNPRYATMRVCLAHAHAAAGNRTRAQVLLDEVTRSGEYASRFYLAIAHATLRNYEHAFQALAEAVEQREWFVILLQHEPALDPLRSDARFDALVQRVGLPVAAGII